jgi:hypothetical protein
MATLAFSAKISLAAAMKCAAIPIVFAATAQALAALIVLDCSTTEVIITNGKPSRRAEQELHFNVDDSTKTIAFVDGTRLRVIRFDAAAISAEQDDMRYEINRVDGTLTYAGSTITGDSTVITVGSGQCRVAPKKITSSTVLHRRAFFLNWIGL